MASIPNVLRERLIATVDQRWEGGLGVILGGPGLGKSTLVRQAMFESAALGRGDEKLIRCRADWTATSLGSAVHRQLFSEIDPNATADPIELVAEYLWAQAPERVGLIFDDLYLLDESGIAYVLELREALPSNAHLLVATRENSLLTALLMTADPAFVVDGGALLFTNDEVDVFASETGVDVPTLDSAGGWPAVLALTVSAGSDVAGAYLYQKVLAGMSRQQQGDLAVAAALGEVEPEVADQVLEGRVNDLGAIPLVHLPAAGGIIVHDLWREPLAGLVASDRLLAALRVAAAHDEEAGDIDRAVSTLAGGGLIAEARDAMLRHIATGADRVPIERIDRWLRILTSPDQALLRQMLELLRGGLVAGSLDDLELDEIEVRCQRAGEADLEALVAEIRFATAWSADDAPQCIAIAERLTDLHERGVAFAAHAPYTRDITAARSMGDNTTVLSLIEQARAEIGGGGLEWNLTLELETLVSLGLPFEGLARLEAAEARLAERKVRSVTYGLTYWFCGRADDGLRSLDEMLRERGRFDGLERSWRATSTLFRLWRGMEEIGSLADFSDNDEKFSTYSRVCEGLTSIARLINAGDEAGAAEAVDDLATKLPPTSGFTLQAWFMGAAAWYVLRPADREMLDGFMTESLYAEVNRLFQAFLAGRETGSIGAESVTGWPSGLQVGTLLPARWAAEVALRLTADNADLAREILGGLEGRGQPMLTLLAADTSQPDLAALATAVMSDRPTPPSETSIVRLFGTPELRHANQSSGQVEPPDWRRGRVRALLGFLAERGHTTREAVIDALWPDLDLDAGRRNLRVTLSYLTKALEPDRAKNAPPWFVHADGETLELNAEGLDFDVLELARHLDDAREHQASGLASKSIDALRAAVETYRGPFLDGLDDAWILDARSVHERRILAACLRLTALLQAGRSDEAVRWARRAVELDPWSIEAHQAVVDALVDGPDDDLAEAEAALAAVFDELA